jgi:hypothetical protein
MRRLKLTLLIIVSWLVVTSLYAYYYVVTILALPEEYDAYARNWKFQLLAFSLVRLPYLVLALTIAIGAVCCLPLKNRGSAC